MDEKTAWEQFFHSGAVQDYLSYRAAAENTAQVPQEETYMQINTDG